MKEFNFRVPMTGAGPGPPPFFNFRGACSGGTDAGQPGSTCQVVAVPPGCVQVGAGRALAACGEHPSQPHATGHRCYDNRPVESLTKPIVSAAAGVGMPQLVKARGCRAESLAGSRSPPRPAAESPGCWARLVAGPHIAEVRSTSLTEWADMLVSHGPSRYDC
jgi:hypothetical protein